MQSQTEINNQIMQVITDMKNSINKLIFALSIQENGEFPAQP